MNKKVLYSIIGVGILAGGIAIYKSFGKIQTGIELETAKVIRGEISDIVTATGKLEAIETVEVGTQVSGVIQKIYVDYNSQVKKGQLLARLDETPLVAQLEQSKATVDQAEAEVNYQKANYERYQTLINKKLIAKSDYDLVVYNYEKAVASLKQAKSVYDKNKINLSYASIYSPIDGIILDRAVDEGQTVAASFNTPTLFTIANDLTQMQVEANVDEADIGRLSIGQRVEFSVDAFPDMKFDGQVTQIRLQPIESSNVITYTVVVEAPNPEKKLMPGMTANVSFFVTEKKNIVLLPAKALSVTISPEEIDRLSEAHPEYSFKDRPDQGKEKSVWIKQGNQIEKRPVQLGETDESHYEVLSGITENDEVIVAINAATAGAGQKAQARSPFMPQRPGSNKKSN